MNSKALRNIFIIVCTVAVICIPTIFAIRYYLDERSLSISNIALAIFFTLTATSIISIANITTCYLFWSKMSSHKSYLKIFFIELLITSVNATLIMIGVVHLFYSIFGHVPDYEQSFEVTLYNNVIIALIVNLLTMTCVEGYRTFLRWKKTTIEYERLQRENAESQYAALKNQVNPHFLFNSLNSLSSLIRVSPEKAIEFVDKFSKIYRYVLDSGEKILIELDEELKFLQSYYFLQKIRFGESLIIETEIDKDNLFYLIPPLSIQILLENAIKHNEISKEFPLHVSIKTEGEFLLISNNLQIKKDIEPSTGIGLKNLQERYSHFTDIKPIFYENGNLYIAKIPLISER